MHYCIYVSTHLCIYAGTPVCRFARMHVRMYACTQRVHVCMCACVHVCIYHASKMYVCILYIYHIIIYGYTYYIYIYDICIYQFQLCHGIPAQKLCKSPIRLNNQHRKFQGPRPWCQLRKEPNRNRLSV